ncbi:hypothetical protein EMIT093MI4_100190 [Pseudomonas sp. IT-93MI4]
MIEAWLTFLFVVVFKTPQFPCRSCRRLGPRSDDLLTFVFQDQDQKIAAFGSSYSELVNLFWLLVKIYS